MKKIISLVLCCLMIVGICGCGNDAATTGGDDKVTLKIGLPGGADVTPMEIVESFKEANPDINVEVDEAPWGDFMTKLQVQIASGNAPDVFITDAGYAATLGGMGAAYNIADRIKNDFKEDEYLSALYAGIDGEGNAWGIPHGLTALGLYYNQAMFDEAGLEYPTDDWTYEDMFEAARKLTKDVNGDGETDQYGLSYGVNITEGWLPFVTAAGGAQLDETRTKSMFNDEKKIEGLKKFAAPQEEGFAPTVEWQRAQGGIAGFYLNKFAMMLTIASNVNAVNANAPADFEYDVVKVPVGWDGQRHTVYVPNLWVIAEKSSDAKKEAAWKWIQHFMSEDSQRLLAETRLAGFPIHKDALKVIEESDAKPNNYMAFCNGVDESGVTLFENSSHKEWTKIAGDYAVNVRQGLIDAETAAKEIHEQISKILK